MKQKWMLFLESSCFHHDPMDVTNLISGYSAFSKPSLYIWKFSIQVLLKPSFKDFEHNLTSMGSEHNCPIVWIFFSTALPWNCDENWPFPVLWPLLGFPNLLTYWVQHFLASSFRIWNSSTGIPSLPLALLVVMLPKAQLTSYSRMSGSMSGNDHTFIIIWVVKIFFV